MVKIHFSIAEYCFLLRPFYSNQFNSQGNPPITTTMQLKEISQVQSYPVLHGVWIYQHSVWFRIGKNSLCQEVQYLIHSHPITLNYFRAKMCMFQLSPSAWHLFVCFYQQSDDSHLHCRICCPPGAISPPNSIIFTSQINWLAHTQLYPTFHELEWPYWQLTYGIKSLV